MQPKLSTGKLAGRPCKDYFKAGGQINLNNLYGLIPPTGRRQLFCPVSVEGRRVLRTKSEPNILIKNRFGLIFDPKYGPDRLKNDEPWYQYINLYFFAKSEPNIFIYCVFLLIYWDHTF